MAVRRRRGRPLDRRPTTTTSAAPEASKGWAPEYIDRLSIPDDDQSWKFARAWTLGEVITALLGAGLRLEAVAEHPVDWWGGHGDVRDEERGRIPLSFSVVGRGRSPSAGTSPAKAAVRLAVDPTDWPTIAERSIGP